MPVRCWVHARRKFYDALTVQPKNTGKATMGLNYIQRLYAIEKSAETVLPKSKIRAAIKYTLHQWEKLRRYLESGELGIDNNITELDIRPLRRVEKTGFSVTR